MRSIPLIDEMELAIHIGITDLDVILEAARQVRLVTQEGLKIDGSVLTMGQEQRLLLAMKELGAGDEQFLELATALDAWMHPKYPAYNRPACI